MPFSSKYTRQNLVQKLPRLPHRALAIADILHNIFKHAVPIGWDWTDEAHDEYRYDLLRFALCCRAFAAPALDVLWQHMPSIDPLLHLLPLRQVDETWVAVDDAESWRMFCLYARRIRNLQVGQISPSQSVTLMYAMKKLGSACLLPALTTLHWSMHWPLARDTFFAFIPLIISDNLREVSLGVLGAFREAVEDHGPAVVAFLIELKQRAKNVQKFDVEYAANEPLALDTIREYITTSPSLAVVKCDCRCLLAEIEFLKDVLRLPQLKSLEILDSSRPGSNRPFSLIVSERVLDVSIHVHSRPGEILEQLGLTFITLLTELKQRAKDVGSIEIDYPADEPHALGVIQDYVMPASSTLAFIRCECPALVMDIQFFKDVMRFPHLITLNIKDRSRSLCIVSASVGFMDVQEFFAKASMEQLVELLTLLPTLKLNRLSLSSNNPDTNYVEHWSTCAHAVGSRFSDTLQYLQVSQSRSGEAGNVFFSSIMLWRPLRRLKTFALDIDHDGFYVPLDDIRRLGTFWPDLIALTLKFGRSIWSPTCLLRFAQALPTLRELTLPLTGPVPSFDDSFLLANDLVTLDVGLYNPDDPIAFAEYIRHLFPIAQLRAQTKRQEEVARLLLGMHRTDTGARLSRQYYENTKHQH